MLHVPNIQELYNRDKTNITGSASRTNN